VTGSNDKCPGGPLGRSTPPRAPTTPSARPAADSANVTPEILNHYPDLSDAQRAIVGHLDSPLLMIAGPGSGKTYCIVLPALNEAV